LPDAPFDGMAKRIYDKHRTLISQACKGKDKEDNCLLTTMIADIQKLLLPDGHIISPDVVDLRNKFLGLKDKRTELLDDRGNCLSEQRFHDLKVRLWQKRLQAKKSSMQDCNDVSALHDKIKAGNKSVVELEGKINTSRTETKVLEIEAQGILEEIKDWIRESQKKRTNSSSGCAQSRPELNTNASKITKRKDATPPQKSSTSSRQPKTPKTAHNGEGMSFVDDVGLANGSVPHEGTSVTTTEAARLPDTQNVIGGSRRPSLPGTISVGNIFETETREQSGTLPSVSGPVNSGNTAHRMLSREQSRNDEQRPVSPRPFSMNNGFQEPQRDDHLRASPLADSAKPGDQYEGREHPSRAGGDPTYLNYANQRGYPRASTTTPSGSPGNLGQIQDGGHQSRESESLPNSRPRTTSFTPKPKYTPKQKSSMNSCHTASVTNMHQSEDSSYQPRGSGALPNSRLRAQSSSSRSMDTTDSDTSVKRHEDIGQQNFKPFAVPNPKSQAHRVNSLKHRRQDTSSVGSPSSSNGQAKMKKRDEVSKSGSSKDRLAETSQDKRRGWDRSYR
jgi:hypothetical protein